MSRTVGREGLTSTRAAKRIYPSVGTVNTPHDITEIRQAIENDPALTREQKRQRLQYMYAISHSEKFRGQFKGNLKQSQGELQRAYKRYTKGKTVSTL
jgi:hypothetical protein